MADSADPTGVCRGSLGTSWCVGRRPDQEATMERVNQLTEQGAVAWRDAVCDMTVGANALTLDGFPGVGFC